MKHGGLPLESEYGGYLGQVKIFFQENIDNLLIIEINTKLNNATFVMN